MNNKKTLAPELRFKGGNGNWLESSVSKMILTTKGAMKIGPFGSQLKKDTFISEGFKVYGQENIFINDFNFGGRYISNEHFNRLKSSEIIPGDFVISTMGTIGKCTIVPIGIIRGIMDSHMIRLQTDNNVITPSFLSQLFISYRTLKQVKRLSVGGIMDGLSIGIVKELKFRIPLVSEQQKIASFLSAVDEKIQQLTRKKELLEQYKKGVMQQLFWGKLRFKDEKGKAFPKWEEKRLGDVLDYIQPTKYLVASTEYDDSYTTPVLTAGKTFILGYTNETNDIYSKNLPVILFDDFTTATQFVDFPFKAKSSAMKILVAKKGENISYIYEAMRLIKFEIGGHGRHWISQFALFNIPYPCNEEQKKIANYLSNIDSKIEIVNKQITQTQTFKKGLLQQMFV